MTTRTRRRPSAEVAELRQAVRHQRLLLRDALACARRYPDGHLGELADRRRAKLATLRDALARARVRTPSLEEMKT